MDEAVEEETDGEGESMMGEKRRVGDGGLGSLMGIDKLKRGNG